MITPGEEKRNLDYFKNTMLLGNNHIINHTAEHALNFWIVPLDFPYTSA